MSYVAPSGNFITVDGGTDVIASGTLRLRLIFGSTSASYTMNVIDYGAVEVDFNYIEEIGDITEFTINTPSIEFTVLNDLSNSGRLIDLITALNANDIIVVEQTYTPSGSSSATEYYYSTREQCEFDYLDRSVKISAKHPLKYGQIGFGKTWGTQLSGKKFSVYSYDNTNYDEKTDSFYSRDLIEQYLDAISDAGTEIYDSSAYSRKFGDTPSENDTDLIFVGPETNADVNFSSATTSVKSLALGEAAILGNVLGYQFYVPRFSKNYGVALTSNNFEELEMDVSFKDVRDYTLEVIYGDNNLDAATLQDIETTANGNPVNEFGRNDVTVTYTKMDGVAGCVYEQTALTGNPFFYLYGSGGGYAFPTSFEDNVREAFKKIFRISSGGVDAGVAISGKILGIDTLKPYQHFSVSSTDGLVDGKDFRPAYLKYDLVNDIIEFEAYEF